MRTWPVLLALLAVGCTQDANDSSERPRTTAPTSISNSTSPSTAAPSPTADPTTPTAPTKRPTAAPTTGPTDPRWAFFTRDRARYASPWFEGRHRVMIPYGCTPAPYYDPDPSCPDGQGFHHGIDVAIPCGTALYAGRPARVLSSDALGPAYGENPVLLRVDGQDVVIGHTRRVYVRVGDLVAAGDRFALVGDSAAPDGCHLHFEVRPAGAGYLDAVSPEELLALTPE